METGLLVVVYNNDGLGGIAEYFEYSRECPDEIINLLKYMRKKWVLIGGENIKYFGEIDTLH